MTAEVITTEQAKEVLLPLGKAAVGIQEVEQGNHITAGRAAEIDAAVNASLVALTSAGYAAGGLEDTQAVIADGEEYATEDGGTITVTIEDGTPSFAYESGE